MENYLKKYSRKKSIESIASILILISIIIYVAIPLGKPIKKSQAYYENALARLYEQNDSLVKLVDDCKRDSNKSFLKGDYYYYEITNKSDSINIKNLNIDLLFLKNVSNQYIYLSVVGPKNIKLYDIAYESVTHQDNFSWSDGRLPENKYVTISIEKLKSFNSDIIIKFSKLSISKTPLVGQLKLIIK